MSSHTTSSPSASATRLYLMGEWSVLRSCLNFGVLFSVAVYIPTGMVTRPKLIAPFHIALGMVTSLCEACDGFAVGAHPVIGVLDSLALVYVLEEETL